MSFLKFGFYATLFAMALFVTSCGAEATSDQSEGDKTEHEEGHDDHDHEEGHDHDSHEANDSSSVDMDSPEYASAYICPMYCKGSGSDAEGKCPKCGMDYVKNENN
jgi:hypothetical protein